MYRRPRRRCNDALVFVSEGAQSEQGQHRAAEEEKRRREMGRRAKRGISWNGDSLAQGQTSGRRAEAWLAMGTADESGKAVSARAGLVGAGRGGQGGAGA